MKVFKQCPALLSSSTDSRVSTITTDDQIFSLAANDTAEINLINQSQPSIYLMPEDFLSHLPSMVSPFNLH
jgi:hypothetical protein